MWNLIIFWTWKCSQTGPPYIVIEYLWSRICSSERLKTQVSSVCGCILSLWVGTSIQVGASDCADVLFRELISEWRSGCGLQVPLNTYTSLDHLTELLQSHPCCLHTGVVLMQKSSKQGKLQVYKKKTGPKVSEVKLWACVTVNTAEQQGC